MTMQYAPLFSGSSGNAAYIATNKTRLLLDAGMSCAALAAALAQVGAHPEALDGVLITHEHTDHIKGVSVLSRKFGLPIYANAATWQAMRCNAEIAPGNIRVFETGRAFVLGDIDVLPFPIPHDAADPVGYALSHGGAKITHMTDLGHVTPSAIDAAERSDIVMVESNHDVGMLKRGRYPAYLKQRILGKRGHLSNDAAGDAVAALLRRARSRFVLGHLSQENNDEDTAYETVMQRLLQLGVDDLPEVYVARRHGPTAVFQID